MYCNGPDEHYIDLACPFGKTNSTLEFCPPVTLFAKSTAYHYARLFNGSEPRIGTYVDDIFGGLAFEPSYRRALHYRNYICQTGSALTLKFNMEVQKTPLPAKRQVILGCEYDSIARIVRTAEKKRVKYTDRILELLASPVTNVKTLQKLHGNLNFAQRLLPSVDLSWLI